MTRSLPSRLAALALGAVAVILFAAPSPAAAHNSLLSSDPADGAVLTSAPTQITWTFDKSVPLDSMTVTLTDPSGARTDVQGSFHGAAGESQVVTPLPPLGDGAVSLRWKLVGADGHPITGRVEFSISASAAAATTTIPGTTAEPPTATSDDVEAGTPAAVRWLLRYASYLAIMGALGIALTTAFVWPGAIDHPTVRRLLSAALLATAALGAAQLLVVAADIGGSSIWSSWSTIGAATSLDIGMSLAMRVVIALSMWLVVFRAGIADSETFWTTTAVAGVALLGTWAFAGHSSSMRWPAVGVASSVAHHGAAAAWLGGLAIVGSICLRQRPVGEHAVALIRFSHVAAVSVGVLVLTGIVQVVRLVGSPLALFDAMHGKLLAAKLVAVAAMIVAGASNRRRLADHTGAGSEQTDTIRRAIAAEVALGVVVVAITAAMVVSAPATSSDSTATSAPLSVTSPLSSPTPIPGRIH